MKITLIEKEKIKFIYDELQKLNTLLVSYLAKYTIDEIKNELGLIKHNLMFYEIIQNISPTINKIYDNQNNIYKIDQIIKMRNEVLPDCVNNFMNCEIDENTFPTLYKILLKMMKLISNIDWLNYAIKKN